MTTATTPTPTTPRDVPGFADHEGRRLRPRVPATPPPPTVRPSSATAGLQALLALPVFFGVFALALALGGGSGRMGATGLLGFFAVAGSAVAALAWLVRRWGRALVAEIEQGYTTTRVVTASWWWRRSSGTGQGVAWDFTGLWYLRPSGEVRAAPVPTPHPPGWYPSPHAPNRLELWTGSQWTARLGDRTDGLLPT
ncbi:hypothetical protein [Phycicoccus sonneratiae]|uniref:DUF2510 domain-containing protein n=1 Tax=Phycicoccus sonneratiae TaxID=2807628 RepID=A0ABS2CQB9_9MICO|nr:hypothetical protein [Phycicoccus sonneraticus]MBM6402030.1 hypothetical protein [Phycicoccus sonneraticus]